MGFFSQLTKAVFETALLPLEVAKDVVTLGGAMTDQEEPYTFLRLKNINKDLENAVDSLGN